MKHIASLALATAVAGCASSAADIAPQYVSPMQYQAYNCAQIAEEAHVVSTRVAQVSGVQDQKRTNDAIATTVGVVVFWPVLFAVKGDGPTAAELGRLKGEMEALERASIMKRCNIQFRQAPPPTAQSTNPQMAGALSGSQ